MFYFNINWVRAKPRKSDKTDYNLHDSTGRNNPKCLFVKECRCYFPLRRWLRWVRKEFMYPTFLSPNFPLNLQNSKVKFRLTSFSNYMIARTLRNIQLRISDLDLKWVRLIPNGTNPGLFNIKFQHFCTEILKKKSVICSILFRSDLLWVKIWPRCSECFDFVNNDLYLYIDLCLDPYVDLFPHSRVDEGTNRKI